MKQKIKKVIVKDFYLKIAEISYSRPKSSDKNDIIEWLAYTGLVENYIRKLEYADIDSNILLDEIQEVWLHICEIDQDKWELLYYQGATAIKAYVSGLIYREIHSSTSLVYKKYKKDYLYMKHISDLAWDVYDETGVMQRTDESISIKESDNERNWRLIETNKTDNILNEKESRKT